MIVLGLHLGHDASVCVVRDGEVVVCLEAERVQRTRRIISLSPSDIVACLDDAGVSVADIDFCAITSTQLIEYLFRDPRRLAITLETHRGHVLPCTLTDTLGVRPETMRRLASGWLQSIFAKPDDHFYRRLLPDGDAIFADPANVLGAFEHFVDFPLWDQVRRFDEIARTDYLPLIENDAASYGFHYPVVTKLLGRDIPSYVFSHHVAHLAYAFYSSPHGEAALLSHDGGGHGGGYLCGLFGYGRGNRLYPFTPHHLAIGEIYDVTANLLALGTVGGAGKLMGLAAYGKPAFYDPSFSGNWYDIGERPPDTWTQHCLALAKTYGYDLSALADPSRMTAPVNADIAASTQRLVEDTIMRAAQTLYLALAGSGRPVRNVSMSGGVALNCPANSLLIEKGPFSSVFVPPAVNDEGLSIGAAQALTHNLCGVPRREPARHTPTIAYLGLRSSANPERVRAAVEAHATLLHVENIDDTAACAAQALAKGSIIGWFEGRSEVGPRALGHRSILAHAGVQDNWARVNQIKGRELWRPLAPAVLEEEAHRYFSPRTLPSYFMLLNSTVTSREIPAVTHVDGSARVQTVSEDCGLVYQLLRRFRDLTGLAVLLNTSFNGPGEPIVETPEHAIKFLLRTTLDELYFPGFRLARRTA